MGDINMAKRLIPTKLYDDLSKELKRVGYIKDIPELKWTNNSALYGYLKYSIRTNKLTGWSCEIYHGLYINKNECPCTQYDFEARPSWSRKYFEELIDTVSHELAHMKLHEHSQEHYDLTELYKSIAWLLIENAGGIMEYIKDCKEK